MNLDLDRTSFPLEKDWICHDGQEQRNSTYIIHGRTLSINLITLFFYYFLFSLACSLLAQALICIFVKQAIDLTVPKLLFPRKRSCLHRNSSFGSVVRRLKKSFSLIDNNLKVHVCALCPSSLPGISVCDRKYPNSCNSAAGDR